MRRLILRQAALAAIGLLLSCKKPRRVRADGSDAPDGELKSVLSVADPYATPQLVRGFHAVESNAWRWTQSRFTVTLRPPYRAEHDGAYLFVKLTAPAPVIDRVGPIRLSANLNGLGLDGETYAKTGDYVYRRSVPASALRANAVTVEFAVDKFLAAGQVEGRELAMIVAAVGLEAK